MTKAPEAVEALSDALAEYLVEQDKDDWCQRLKYGQCPLRKCLISREGILQFPISYDSATCPRYRLEQAREYLQKEGKE